MLYPPKDIALIGVCIETKYDQVFVSGQRMLHHNFLLSLTILSDCFSEFLVDDTWLV